MKFLLLALLPAVALCQLGMPGGWSDATSQMKVDDEEVAFAIQAATTKLSTMTNLGANQLHVSIVAAQTQVVQGENLKLTLKMTHDFFCNCTVWYRSWLKGDERMIVTDGPVCFRKQQVRRQMVGGVSQAHKLPASGMDSNGNNLMAALSFASCAYNDRSNNMFASRLGDTSGVTYTSQVVSGMLYRFKDVPMQTTDCRTGSDCNDLMDMSLCNTLTQGHTSMTCDFTVQDQAWMKPQFTLADMSCH